MGEGRAGGDWEETMADVVPDPPAADAAGQHQDRDETWGRWIIFVYCVVILAVLVWLAWLYGRDSLHDLIPESVPGPALASAWAGALGGIAISFKGVYDHKGKLDSFDDPKKNTVWSNEMIPWHLGRPFSGIIVGIFVYIALQAVYPSGTPSGFTLAAASFVLGTQDRAFFEFVRKIGGIVVTVPDPPPKKNT
jgi:hypothetical protein